MCVLVPKKKVSIFLFCVISWKTPFINVVVLFWACRRDSFITHRAFCDALAEESAKAQTLGSSQLGNPNPAKAVVVASPPPPPLTPSNNVVSPALSIQSSGNIN